MTVIAVTDATFEREVLAAELPVLIDLYADWCQPCKQLAPVVAGIAGELQGIIKVVKIDIERSPGVAQMFRVQSIPMLVVMHGGRPVAAEQGVLDRAQLLEMLAPFLPQAATALKPAELAQLLKQGQVLPVDVRDERSFGRFRIPGAINVPVETAATRVAELAPTDGRLRVLYSRTEDDAKQLADTLGKQGVEVGFLSGGFLHWEADGLEVERG
ncbi:MAG: thioredoxin domain-containing protein [Polyangiales bacterium]|nr:thioredoxin [Myxococcales bacterium]MCB9657048.1 thioredoxin [Sandaracinaceae bacterium]